MWILQFRTALLLAILWVAPAAFAQHTDGSTTHGDVFGDLYHIKRIPETGQPILQKRWIEYPGDEYDWGYCPIPVDATGNEIPLLPLSCEVNPNFASALVELDYFGRLSMGRTKESNLRMHFDEVISKINSAQIVDRDPAGRLKIGTNCQILDGAVVPDTCVYKLVDSPGENLALYNRAMRYGHLQTDPLEEDDSMGGDPAAGTVYRPALTAADYAKFVGAMETLLPVPPAQASTCFNAGDFTCDNPQALTANDFVVVSSFLATAGDKTGRVTVDLLQYLHRILKITQDTAMAAATLRTLPAKIRDCGPDPDNQIEDVSLCAIVDADPDDPNLPAVAKERFVDYSPVKYVRTQWFDKLLDVLRPYSIDTFVRASDVPLLGWLDFVNPGRDSGTNIVGFVNVSSDAVRTVEFLHEYELPADLGWDFGTGVVQNPPLVVMGLAANKASPQPAGTAITLMATASGGTAPIQFKFLLTDGTTTTVLRDWSTGYIYVWAPALPNPNYVVKVWARSAGSTLDAPEKINAQAELPFQIGSALTIASLTAAPASPQPPGTPITFTAAATNGIMPYLYKWDVYDGEEWLPILGWSSTMAVVWPTAANGVYNIRVTVRDAALLEAVAVLPFVVAVVPPPPPPPPPPSTPAEPTPPAPATPSLAPTELAATVDGPFVRLSWIPPAGVSGITGYLLEAGTEPGATTATIETADTSFTTNALGSGKFYVRVRTRLGEQLSEPSNEVAFNLGGVPSRPLNVAATVEGPVVRLTWLSPEFGPVDDYEVHIGSGSGMNDLGIVRVPGSLRVISGSVGNGSYYLHVHSVNGRGTSDQSEVVMVSVGDNVPGAPEDLRATVSGSNVALSWRAPSGASPHGYVLEVGSAPGLSDLGVLPVSGNSLTTAGVPQGTYFVRLRAMVRLQDRDMTGPACRDVIVSVNGGATLPPGRPYGLTAHVTGSAVRLQWTLGAGGGPTHHFIHVGSAPGGSDLGVFQVGPSSLFSTAGVASGKYYVRIVAANAFGTSDASEDVLVTVP